VNCPGGNRRPARGVEDGVMTPRLALPLLAVVAGLSAAACGSERVDVSDQPSGGITYPTGSDQTVVRLSTGGGFGPEGADFRTPPELVITGDGTVFRPGAQIEIFPPPLLPAITTATVDPAGMQAVLDAAKAAGMLSPAPSYEPGPGAAQVADAPTTTLEVDANDQTYRHQAYALGFQPNGTESTPQRAALDRFVTQLKDLPTLVGDHLSAEKVYTPERFGVTARPATPEELAPTPDQITPEVVPWPDGAPPLSSLAQCTEVPEAAVGDTFAKANQLTRFSQAGQTYTVFVRVLLPGESCDG
jgi:hypothetical protein